MSTSILQSVNPLLSHFIQINNRQMTATAAMHYDLTLNWFGCCSGGTNALLYCNCCNRSWKSVETDSEATTKKTQDWKKIQEILETHVKATLHLFHCYSNAVQFLLWIVRNVNKNQKVQSIKSTSDCKIFNCIVFQQTKQIHTYIQSHIYTNKYARNPFRLLPLNSIHFPFEHQQLKIININSRPYKLSAFIWCSCFLPSGFSSVPKVG